MDYYQVLGVPRNATLFEIKSHFRRRAKKEHPDKGGDTAKWQEVQRAYDTLSDPEKRARYDRGEGDAPERIDPFRAEVLKIMHSMVMVSAGKKGPFKRLVYKELDEAKSAITEGRNSAAETLARVDLALRATSPTDEIGQAYVDSLQASRNELQNRLNTADHKLRVVAEIRKIVQATDEDVNLYPPVVEAEEEEDQIQGFLGNLLRNKRTFGI